MIEVAYWDLRNWLVMYRELCIKRRDCHYRTSPIGYWGKGLTISWYKVLEFLVTACCDNSGFSRVVTLKSPGGIFAVLKTNHRVNLFSAALNLIGDLFVLSRVCMLI